MPTPVPDNGDSRELREPVFVSLPSGLDIAHWFRDEAFARRFENVGGDAILLWQEDDNLYPYGTLHKVAEVDHDDQMFYLLDVGEQTEDGPAVSDLLFVTAGLRKDLACEWRNEPSERQPWHYEGLVWFAGLIDEYERTWREAAQNGRPSDG